MKRFKLPNGFTFDSYLRKIVKEKFSYFIECGIIEFSKELTKESYENRIEAELDFIQSNNLAESFLVLCDVIKNAVENKARTNTLYPFNWVVGYLLNITQVNPIDKEQPKAETIYLSVYFGGLSEKSFIDYIVNQYGFIKPLKNECVYLLQSENVFIQLEIEQPKTDIKVIGENDINTLKNNAKEFFNNAKIHTEDTDSKVMALINNKAFTIVKEDLENFCDIKKYLIEKYNQALDFVLCKESVRTMEIQKELKIGFMLAEYLLVQLEKQDVISTLFFETRERKVIMKQDKNICFKRL